MSPHVMPLQDAIREIVGAQRPRPWQSDPAPPSPRFFFIVGAGISYPSIPLASGIEELCRQELETQRRKLSPVPASKMERYEKYFQEAFPHPEERRAFLHHHIQRAPISAANFRLAHLVGPGKFTNLVVTTNFDELLTKALRLFGMDVIVCDHPKTTQRIDPQRDDIQVIHAHGTHWFYDCCNLKDEIKHRAQADGEDNSSMGQLLDRILYERSPLVIGYSGWEDDVIMAALKRRLRRPLSYNLYWFCFRRADMEELPQWLKEHGNVRFVVPEEASGACAPPSATGGTKLAANSPAGALGDSGPREPTLSARQVFDTMLRGLNLPPPPSLTKDPLAFFADQLKKNLAAEDVSNEDDIYLIQQVIQRVEEGARLAQEAMERCPQKEKELAALLERVCEFVRSAEHAAAIKVAQDIKLEDLVKSQGADNLDAALDTIYQIASDSEMELRLDACDLRIRLCEAAQTSSDKQLDWLLREAQALHDKGHCLGAMDRRSEEISAYDEILRRFNSSTVPALMDRVAMALTKKGDALRRDDKYSEAIVTYDEVLRRFGAATELSLKEMIAEATQAKDLALEASRE